MIANDVNDADDRLTVTKAPTQLWWHDVAVISDHPLVFDLYDRPGLGSGSEVATEAVVVDASGTAALVSGGDEIRFCGGTLAAGADQANVRVQLIHRGTNRVIADRVFSQVAACA